MSQNRWYKFLRVSTTLPGLAKGHFFVLRLPEPSLIVLDDHSTVKPQTRGGQGRHGYIRGSITWEELTQRQMNALRRLIEEAETDSEEGSGVLYFTLPRTTAEASGLDLVDISGIVPMPEMRPQTVGLYGGVVLNINNVTIEATPSSVL